MAYLSFKTFIDKLCMPNCSDQKIYFIGVNLCYAQYILTDINGYV